MSSGAGIRPEEEASQANQEQVPGTIAVCPTPLMNRRNVLFMKRFWP